MYESSWCYSLESLRVSIRKRWRVTSSFPHLSDLIPRETETAHVALYLIITYKQYIGQVPLVSSECLRLAFPSHPLSSVVFFRRGGLLW